MKGLQKKPQDARTKLPCPRPMLKKAFLKKLYEEIIEEFIFGNICTLLTALSFITHFFQNTWNEIALVILST